ncbi:uncharacterized protein LOC135205459 [Macrobrachium nipponense]|uniref:uncharacterized protein LOC135205459 n=1 Tax=Macrobrachium nipponense TaxID=159736 RepID=UPI0030C81609
MASVSQNGACGWRISAPRKNPKSLLDLSRSTVVKEIALPAMTNYPENKNYLTTVCGLLSHFLPWDLRTSVIRETIERQETEDPEQVMSALLLQLLTNVRHFFLTAAGAKSEKWIHLQSHESHSLLQELENVVEFRMESFRLEGVSMEAGTLTQILRRSPRLMSIHISGTLCHEILSHLNSFPCDLLSLRLDNCSVTDEDVVRSLLNTEQKFETLGRIICVGGDATEIEKKCQHSLKNLSVQSPLLTGFGSVVLLNFLRGLQNIQYTSWNSSTFDTLLFLEKVSPENPSFSLTSIDLWRPTDDALLSLKSFCPKLRQLMIECYDPGLSSLAMLSALEDLSSLTLRLMSEELIISAVKSVGCNLRELEIEFETFTFHSVSLETLKLVHESCPHLQRLEIRHVCLEARGDESRPSLRLPMFPNLKYLVLSSAVIQPAVLERLLIGNSSLENLVLDVNHDALTDSVLDELLKNNEMNLLRSVFLGAGSLSPKTLTSLIRLPSLQKLSLDLKRFPFIPVSTFSSLENDLIKGNFLCALENVLQDDV